MNSFRNRPGLRLLILFISVVSVLGSNHVAHADDVRFYMKFSGARLRSQPSAIAPLSAPVSYDATYPVVGRSTDGMWLQLQVAGATGWLSRGFGDVQGNLDTLPATKPAMVPIIKNTNRIALPKWIGMTPRGKAMLQQGIKAGRDGRLFTMAGDSNAQWPVLLGLQVGGEIDVAQRQPSLRDVLARFAPGLAHVSVAVGGGFRAADMFDVNFAQKPATCLPAEGVFACELRLSNASVVFIQLGTGDRFAWKDYEPTYRAMLDTALAANVLPVLFTKADEMESYQGGAPMGYLNDVVRKLAAEYQLPMVEFFAATRDLPTVPNPDLPNRPLIQHGLHDEWGYYFHLTEEGRTLKLVSMLQMLDALTRG